MLLPANPTWAAAASERRQVVKSGLLKARIVQENAELWKHKDVIIDYIRAVTENHS